MPVHTLAAYISAAPKDLQPTLRELRALVESAFPGIKPETAARTGAFPVYARDGVWLTGFGWRKKGAMLYCMNVAVVDKYAKRLGKLRTGKSCIKYKASKSLTLDELRSLAREMLFKSASAAGVTGKSKPTRSTKPTRASMRANATKPAKS